jgi:hypothetical protein
MGNGLKGGGGFKKGKRMKAYRHKICKLTLVTKSHKKLILKKQKSQGLSPLHSAKSLKSSFLNK